MLVRLSSRFSSGITVAFPRPGGVMACSCRRMVTKPLMPKAGKSGKTWSASYSVLHVRFAPYYLPPLEISFSATPLGSCIPSDSPAIGLVIVCFKEERHGLREQLFCRGRRAARLGELESLFLESAINISTPPMIPAHIHKLVSTASPNSFRSLEQRSLAPPTRSKSEDRVCAEPSLRTEKAAQVCPLSLRQFPSSTTSRLVVVGNYSLRMPCLEMRPFQPLKYSSE